MNDTKLFVVAIFAFVLRVGDIWYRTYDKLGRTKLIAELSRLNMFSVDLPDFIDVKHNCALKENV